jgi:hypothetical protein
MLISHSSLLLFGERYVNRILRKMVVA